LIDEANKLHLDQTELLKKRFDENEIYSIILSSTEKNNLNLSNSFRQRISECFRLNKLTKKELRELLELRFHRENPLSPDTMNYLINVSDGNPREFLLDAKRVCIKMHEIVGEGKTISLSSSKEALKKTEKAGNGLVKEKPKASIAKNLTPLQRNILFRLKEHPMTLKELSEAVGSSIGTVGKQISILSLKTKKDYMRRKGINEELIEKNKTDTYTVYSLSEKAKDLLKN
jgi:hypothetical protein